MLHLHFSRLVDFCIRHSRLVIVIAVLLGAGSTAYVVRHFAINTDISNLLSPDLPWRKRDAAYLAAFPQQATSILAVV
jgi:uncharacterized protein